MNYFVADDSFNYKNKECSCASCNYDSSTSTITYSNLIFRYIHINVQSLLFNNSRFTSLFYVTSIVIAVTACYQDVSLLMGSLDSNFSIRIQFCHLVFFRHNGIR